MSFCVHNLYALLIRSKPEVASTYCQQLWNVLGRARRVPDSWLWTAGTEVSADADIGLAWRPEPRLGPSC
jgi:hypothetical protein